MNALATTRERIRDAAEGVALDADMLADLRLRASADLKQGVQTGGLEIIAPDGRPCLVEYAHDLMRIALVNCDYDGAREIAMLVHNEIIDELAARPKLIGMEAVK